LHDAEAIHDRQHSQELRRHTRPSGRLEELLAWSKPPGSMSCCSTSEQTRWTSSSSGWRTPAR
jgi:hypothetical protein